MEFKHYMVFKDLVVVGGGLPGICAAIQAARHGLSVALINNRGYLGGNSGAEQYVTVCGATGTQEFNFYARETGIVEELLLENRYRNQGGNRFIWDTVLLDFVYREKNIELFLNTNVDSVEMENENQILYASGVQNTTEKRFDFYGGLFLDDTGDGVFGNLAGAQYHMGREAAAEFNESLAPIKSDRYVLPSTLYFTSHDIGRPVKYIPPDFALNIPQTGVLEHRIIPADNFYRSQWYYEIGGELDQIYDNEEIIKKHRALAYGIWDYIKNSGKYNSENYDLTYVSCLPGKRESRRLIGNYVLTQNDILEQSDFHDTVGYGGWSIDLHALEGFFSKELINKHVYLKGIYQIPYRCGYSKNISNLFMAGRCMSTSHVAFGSTRVMATLSTLGQALGTAAFLCKKYNTTPHGIYEEHLGELQETIILNDQFIIGKPLKKDKSTTVTATSTKKCELIDMDSDIVLEKNIAILLPVRKRIDNISVKIKCNSETELKYAVYMPMKKENYNPEKLIINGSIRLKKSDDFNWIKLSLGFDINENKIFIEFISNPYISFASSKDKLIGVDCMIKESSHDPCVVDCETFSAKEYLWKRLDNTICFTYSNNEDIYSIDNILSGYKRPYGLPNIWISDDKTEDEEIILKFRNAKEINTLQLTFDSDLNLYYWNTLVYEGNVFSDIVKDYSLYIKTNNEYKKLLDVKGNYQRVNCHKFNKMTAEEIKIVFSATNGVKNIRIYGVEAFFKE